jgi:phosphoglycolate phosphatase-like HAD superfamily hydrolase
MSDSPTRLAAIMSSATSIVFDKDGTLVDLDARWAPSSTSQNNSATLGSSPC